MSAENLFKKISDLFITAYNEVTEGLEFNLYLVQFLSTKAQSSFGEVKDVKVGK